ncbi:chitin synthase III catalytic subunit [Kalaharituber pfeilii]|nr:chitin synthase III catalytic subunit [Kalaharituber pfeilii]
MSQFGKFDGDWRHYLTRNILKGAQANIFGALVQDFCRDSTLPVCHLFPVVKSCPLVGFEVNGDQLRNLGAIILCGIAILVSILLLWMSEKKQAAVGRREMQVLIIGYMVISFAEIFTVGGIPIRTTVRQWFTGIHIGAITATFWVLLLNAIVGFQLLDDGTWLSISLVAGSGLIVFLGTGYITMDSAFGWTDEFLTIQESGNRNYALYVLYLLFPLIAIVAYYILEAVLVLHVLGEKRPMVLLTGSVLLFAIGQIFNFVISVHLCKAADGKIDGSLFQTFFSLLAIVTLWFFWSSITEDTWQDEPLNTTEEMSYGP